MKQDRTLCLYGEWFILLDVISILTSGKLSSCRSKSGSENKGEIPFSLATAELSVMNTGLLAEVRPHASLYGIAVSPPCHVSYIHTSQRSEWLRSQWLPAPASTHTKAELDTPRLLQGTSSAFTHVISGEYGNITETRAYSDSQ